MSESSQESHVGYGVGIGLAFLALGAALLALANLFVPFLAPLIAPTLGLLAFRLLFRFPGKITWKRDLTLGIGVLLVFLVIWAVKNFICGSISVQQLTCSSNHLAADLFLNAFCFVSPLFLLWSYVRYRSLKYKLLKRNEEEILDI